MCHDKASGYFPAPRSTGSIKGQVEGLTFGNANAKLKIAIIPDIYGTNAFYQGLATRLTAQGTAAVSLVNPFAGLGDLPEITREAAFGRRQKVKDKEFVDRFQAFCESQAITGVVGFCLGGFYVFELARRNVSQALVGFYGFPQGMQNQDPLPDPFDYLGGLSKTHLSLMPGQDASVGRENVDRLARLGDTTEGLQVRVYEESGHGFLSDVDSGDEALRANALAALAECERHLGLTASP